VTARQSVDYFENLIAKAGSAVQILAIVADYLASWPQERVANLQQLDGSWAPFDNQGRPKEVMNAWDLSSIAEGLSCHCTALHEAGIAIPPELIELESFFALADHSVRRLATAVPRYSALTGQIGFAQLTSMVEPDGLRSRKTLRKTR
jgi:hypothetical protein